MANPRKPLRLNVGFLINSPIGTSRDFIFEDPDIRISDDLQLKSFDGTAVFSRTPQGLLLQAEFSGKTSLECVRCLNEYQQKITWDMTELYAFSKRSVSESGLILPEDGHVDLHPLVREYALLEIPIKPICKPECKGLCPVCGEDLNLIDCGHRPSTEDSPFAALKKLLEEE